MPGTSAGILPYRIRGSAVEVLLVHPGGPFWARKDAGAWSIPKGELDPGEEPLDAALRELAEETGATVAPIDLALLIPLGTITQKAGKSVTAWAGALELDAEAITSTTFTLEWPPRSGVLKEFPEVDRSEWLTLDAARAKLNPAQLAFLDRLEVALEGGDPTTLAPS